MHPLAATVGAALASDPAVAGRLDTDGPAGVPLLASLSTSGDGCAQAYCTTFVDLALDLDLVAGQTRFGLGLLGSEIPSLDGDSLTFTVSDSSSVRAFTFSDPAAATASFADHVLAIDLAPDARGHGQLGLELSFTSAGYYSGLFASARFVLAPLAAPEPSLPALFATLAALVPGWRNWQTRRP